MLLGCVLLLISCRIVSATPVQTETCEDTHKCVATGKCPSAVYTVDQQRQHHGYDVCGWDGSEQLICCPKNESTIEQKLGTPFAEIACENFTKSKPGLVGTQILGGEVAEVGEFPHMAALGYRVNGRLVWGRCGGSLISYDYVLTAAHCASPRFEGEEINVTAVRLGKLNLTEDSYDPYAQDINVMSIHVHEKYNRTEKQNDVALLRLEKPISISGYVAPACLHLDQKDPEIHITVSGWGTTSASSGTTSDVLMKVKLKAFDTVSCKDSYNIGPLPKLITASQLCAISPDEKKRDTCSGDSGGPAQIIVGEAIFVVGVTSFGPCAIKPGVYARVASYVEWIEGIVWSQKP